MGGKEWGAVGVEAASVTNFLKSTTSRLREMWQSLEEGEKINGVLFQ